MSDKRLSNQNYILKDESLLLIINQMETIITIIEDYSYLIFCRDFISVKNKVFSLQHIMQSIEVTLNNFLDCCKNGSFADANTLLRKYRDDLFFALYIIVYDVNFKIGETKNLLKMENNIEKWFKNNLSNLNITEVLKQIAACSCISEAATKYNLRKSFSEIGDRLNNYVHSNGRSFYNELAISLPKDKLSLKLNSIRSDLFYITTTFFFLLSLRAPSYIMADDYIDFLEMGETPLDNSQYYIAPFIEKFIKNNIQTLGNDCYLYLKENSIMDFE